MVPAKPCLDGVMQLPLLCKGGQPAVHDRHEQLAEGWGDSNAAITMHISRVPLPFIQRNHLCVPPGLGCQLSNSTITQKLCKPLHPRLPHVLQELQGKGAQPRRPIGLKVGGQHLLQLSSSHNSRVYIMERLIISGGGSGVTKQLTIKLCKLL